MWFLTKYSQNFRCSWVILPKTDINNELKVWAPSFSVVDKWFLEFECALKNVEMTILSPDDLNRCWGDCSILWFMEDNHIVHTFKYFNTLFTWSEHRQYKDWNSYRTKNLFNLDRLTFHEFSNLFHIKNWNFVQIVL